MKIMVTGSRSWKDREAIRVALEQLDGEDVTLIHGDAEGADSLAASVGNELGWNVVAYPAAWNLYGKSAGPRRNTEMVQSRPDLVVAFPGPRSKGTTDAMTKARAWGIPVWTPAERPIYEPDRPDDGPPPEIP